MEQQINLNDEKYAMPVNKVVFNGGKAGVVNNCKARFEARKATDPDNTPKYRIILVDENGGEINLGFFLPKPDASEKAVDLFVKQLRHLADVFSVSNKLKGTYNNLSELMDDVIKNCYENQDAALYTVGVAYGTVGYPKAYLTIRWMFDIKKNGDAVYMAKDALYTRPEPTVISNDNSTVTNAEPAKDGLPF